MILYFYAVHLTIKHINDDVDGRSFWNPDIMLETKSQTSL